MEKSFGTVSQTVEGLKREGYTMDFNIHQDCLTCHKTNTVLSPDEFEIDAVYRFEGESNPDDEAVVYAISSPIYKVKGILVNAYGPYADEVSNALVQKLHQQYKTSKNNMEVKPIKRNKHILQLSKDHHFTLLFSWKIRQGLKYGVDTDRIKEYVQYFWQRDMQDHFREEEEILFAVVKDAKVQKALDDHSQIKEQVEQVLKTPERDDASKKLSLLADTVDAHVRYEERELFPHLEKILTEAQLENIGAQLKDEQALKDEYADEFWIKNK